MQPGNAGGSNWGGIAFDPQRQLAVVNTMNLPFLVALIPRAGTLAAVSMPVTTRTSNSGASRARRTACAASRSCRASAFPASNRPGARSTAVDMQHGTIKWQIPLGDTPWIHLNLGMPGLGGPIVTASGLMFIAATLDDRLRAFDTDSGKLLWEVKLPAGGQATPMTYSARRSPISGDRGGRIQGQERPRRLSDRVRAAAMNTAGRNLLRI